MAKMKEQQLSDYHPLRKDESLNKAALNKAMLPSRLQSIFGDHSDRSRIIHRYADPRTSSREEYLPALISALSDAGKDLSWESITGIASDPDANMGVDISNRHYRDLIKIAAHEVNGIKFGCEYLDRYGLKEDAMFVSDIDKKAFIESIRKHHPDIFDDEGDTIDDSLLSDYTALNALYLSRKMNTNHPDDRISDILGNIMKLTGLYSPIHSTIDGEEDMLPMPVRIITVPQTDLKRISGSGGKYYTSTFNDDMKDLISTHAYLGDFIDSLPMKGTEMITGRTTNNLGVIARPVLNEEYFNGEEKAKFIDYIQNRCLVNGQKSLDPFDKFVGNSSKYPVTLNVYVPVEDNKAVSVGQALHLIALVDELVNGAQLFKCRVSGDRIQSLDNVGVVNDIDIMEYLLHGLITEVRHDICKVQDEAIGRSSVESGKARFIFETLTAKTTKSGDKFASLSALLSGIGTITTGSPNSDAAYYPRQVAKRQYKSAPGVTMAAIDSLGGENVLDHTLMGSRHTGHDGIAYSDSPIPGSVGKGSAIFEHAASSQLLKAMNFSLFSNNTAKEYFEGKIVEYFNIGTYEKHKDSWRIEDLSDFLLPTTTRESQGKSLQNIQRVAGRFGFIYSLLDLITGVSSCTITNTPARHNAALAINHPSFKRLDCRIVSPLEYEYASINRNNIYRVSDEGINVINYVFRKIIINTMSAHKELVRPRNTFVKATFDMEAVNAICENIDMVAETESIASMVAVSKFGYSEEELDVCYAEVHTMINDEDRWMTMSRISKNITKAKKKLSKTNDVGEKAMIKDFITRMGEVQSLCRSKHIVKAHEAPLISFSGNGATSDLDKILDEY